MEARRLWQRAVERLVIVCAGCKRELPVAAFPPDGQVRVEEFHAHDLLELALDTAPETWCWHCVADRVRPLLEAMRVLVHEQAARWAPA